MWDKVDNIIDMISILENIKMIKTDNDKLFYQNEVNKLRIEAIENEMKHKLEQKDMVIEKKDFVIELSKKDVLLEKKDNEILQLKHKI